MKDWLQQLSEQYETKIENPGIWGYPKSHWLGCSYGSSNTDRRIELPSEAPAEFISCNSCLIREGYFRILPCNPRVIGWPHHWRKCDICEYGLDCETWARVRGAGSHVVIALRRLDPDAYHPVTWLETGLVPFRNDGDLFFPTKAELDRFMSDVTERYPGHFDGSSEQPCYCLSFAEEALDLNDGGVTRKVSPAVPVQNDVATTNVGPDGCSRSHCIGFREQFGFFPNSHYTHTP